MIEQFEDLEYYYIILEYCNYGDLNYLLHKNKNPLSEDEATYIISQILQAFYLL